MVVDGRTEFVGNDESAARRAIEDSAKAARALVRVVAGADTGSARVTVAGARGEGAEVLLAVTEDAAVSDVTRGENAGKKLAHVAVARELRVVGAVDARGRFDASVALATLHGIGPRHLVAFVQERGSGRVSASRRPLSLRAP